jgi:ketosteroid isomerase-like protein
MARMKAFFRKNMPLVPMRFVRHDTLTDGERVALELESFGGTAHGTYNNRYCFIMTVRDGLIVRINEYVDTRYAAEALVPLLRQARPPVDGVSHQTVATPDE